MSTIASPRPSLSTTTSSSSHRNAVEAAPRSPASTAPPNTRRNRAALRDYYGLKNAAHADASSGAQRDDTEKESELDKDGFNAEAYVKRLLETENLEGLLRVEGGLVNEIRGLDGERKALVYDNYSKLIAATDTIRNMRTKMEPLTLTTSTLSPTIAHIAELSSSLSTTLHENPPTKTGDDRRLSAAGGEVEDSQVETVRWVLNAPARLRGMIENGRREDAERDWLEISTLLEKWASVRGAEEVKTQCQRVMKAE